MRLISMKFPRKHRWLWFSTAFLLAIVCYFLSYPVAFRLLAGSDSYYRDLAERNVEEEIAPVCLGPGPELHSGSCWEAWGYLRRYYYPPVEWATDCRYVRSPLLVVARLLDVEMQISSDIDSRRIFGLLERGNLDQAIKEQERMLEEYERQLSTRDQSPEEAAQSNSQ